MTRPIAAVSFDVGGTLIEPFPSVGHIYSQVATSHGLPRCDAAILNRNFGRAWQAKQEFDYSREAWFQLVRATFREFCEVPPDVFDAIYSAFASASPWRVFDDVLPALTGLRERSMRLIVISNWDERLRPLLGDLRLGDWFEQIFVSTEIGAHKPDPKIFQAAASRIGLDTTEILHVGDGNEEDYLGAMRAGYHSARVVRDRATRGPHEIASLLDLGKLLGAAVT